MPANDPVTHDVHSQASAQPKDDRLNEAASAAAPVPAFSFPFNPAKFADATKKAPAYPGAGKSRHDKTPSRAPNGSRRSMGKR